jgi:hypothetical protein
MSSYAPLRVGQEAGVGLAPRGHVRAAEPMNIIGCGHSNLRDIAVRHLLPRRTDQFQLFSKWPRISDCSTDPGAANSQRRRYLRRAHGWPKNRDLAEQQHNHPIPNHVGGVQAHHFEATN